uniref:Alpha-(1,6)-fucosyltransferase n=1 Tax=Heterorhabditis bacteriophora TaxID=37862 RepID=A0A1I7XK46_HETBA
MWTMKSAALVAIALWFMMLMYLSTQMFGLQSRVTHEDGKLITQLGEAISSLKKMKKQNEELWSIIEAEQKNYSLFSLLATASNLSDVDDAAQWRKRSLQKLTDTIQHKIYEIQNPTDCSKARTLICNLDKECGFGCQMHHVAYCFVTAFGTRRMMVLNNNGIHWRYSQKGWTGAFLPITSCTFEDTVGSTIPSVFSIDSTARIVSLGIVDGLPNKPQFLPLSFPSSISDQLIKLHSNPPVFFISQFIWYLMRSNENLKSELDSATRSIPFSKGPVVGLQVRRTDKVGTEADFHSIDEYIQWTEIWFKVQERKQGRNITRRVYIATDDPSVIPETRQKYPNYEVYGDTKIANTAQLRNRYSDTSLYGVVTDIRLLSQCDYLVCTFSSQVCRMGFELMQVLQGDAGEKFHSLDDLYYYGGQYAHEQVAIENHEPENQNEIELQVGDTVGVAGNHWDGYSKGNNRRTGKTGLYPSYKSLTCGLPNLYGIAAGFFAELNDYEH